MKNRFSHRTIAQKMGVNPGDDIIVINQPENYSSLLGILIPPSFVLHPNSPFIHYFAHTKSQLEKDFPKLKKHLALNGTLWISNPKGQADFNQNDVMEIGLKNGLVDIKIASLNDSWSAMKFVYRIKANE